MYDDEKTRLVRVAHSLSTTTLLVDTGDSTYAMHYDAESSMLSTKKVWPSTERPDEPINRKPCANAWLHLAADVAALTRSQASFFDALQGES
jgi:hypothetical protein